MKQQLLQSRSKKNIEKVAEAAALHPDYFKELVGLMKDQNELHLASLAAWAMSNACDRNKQLIKPFYKDLMALAKVTDHDGIKRNIVRVWQMVDIPEKYRWEIAEISLGFLSTPLESIAVKAFSITVLQNLIKFLPEIKEEVLFEIEKQLPHSGPAFKSRANACLKAVL